MSAKDTKAAEKKALQEIKRYQEEAKKAMKKNDLMETARFYGSGLEIAKQYKIEDLTLELEQAFEITQLKYYSILVNDALKSALFAEMTQKFTEAVGYYDRILQIAEEMAKKGIKLGDSETLLPIVQAVFVKFVVFFEAIFAASTYDDRNLQFRIWKQFTDTYFCSMLPFFQVKMVGPEQTNKMVSYFVQMNVVNDQYLIYMYHVEDVEGPSVLFLLNPDQYTSLKADSENRCNFYQWILTHLQNSNSTLQKIKFEKAYMGKTVEITPKEPFYRIGDPYLILIKLFYDQKFDAIFQNWDKYSQFFPEPPFSKNIIKLSVDQRKITVFHPAKKSSFTIDYDRGKIVCSLNVNQKSTYQSTDANYREHLLKMLANFEPEIKRPK